MSGAENRIGQALVQCGLIDDLQLRSAQSHQSKFGGRLQRIIVELGFAREDRIADALAAAFGAPRVDLETLKIDRDALKKLDAAFCEQRSVFPCAVRDNGKLLFIAVDDPTDLELLDGIGLRADVPRVKPVVAGHDEIQVAILRHYRGESIQATRRGGPPTGSIELGEGDAAVEITDPLGGIVSRSPLAPRPAAGPAPGGNGHAPASGDGLSSDDLRRLEAVRDAQERGARVLKTIVQLCSEKGVFGLEELRSRLKPR